MLSRTKRLRRAEFNTFFGLGKRFHSPSFQLIYAPHADFKASAVISKKLAASAVVRNKYRRRVYAVFEEALKEGLRGGVFICIAKDKAAVLPYQTLKEELRELIHKVSILR